MRNTLLLLLANIRRTRVSFIAILLFTALGVALFTGLTDCGVSFQSTVSAQLNEGKLYDYELSFPLEVAEDEMEELNGILCADTLEGVYDTVQSFSLGKDTLYTKIVLITKKIDLLYDIEGTLPEKEGEIAVEKRFAENNGIKVGDKIVFDRDDEVLKVYFDMLPAEAESLASLFGLALGDEDGVLHLRGNTFTVTALAESPAYISAVSSNYEMTNTPISCYMFAPRAAFDESSFRGYTKLLARYDEGENGSGMRKLLRDTNELSFLAGGYYSDRYLPVLKNLLYELTDENLSAKDKELAEELTAELRELMLIPDFAKLLSFVGLPPEEVTFDREFADKLLDALKNDFPLCTALSYEGNAGYVMSTVVVEMFDKLRFTLSLPFLLIGFFICYSAMSRVVGGDTVLIGTEKALGMSKREIRAPYLLYAASASLVGAVIGILMGRFFVQPALMFTLKEPYLLTLSVFRFNHLSAGITALGEVIFTMLFAFIAVFRATLKEPTELLVGGIPNGGKAHFYEKYKLFDRLSPLNKCIVNNFASDRRRVAATLIGISGCTALLVCALLFGSSVLFSIDRQYSMIQSYDTVVNFNDIDPAARENIDEALENMGLRHTVARDANVAVCSEGRGLIISHLTIFPDENFEEFFRLYDGSSRVTAEELKDGIYINCGFAEVHDLEKGSTVTCVSSDFGTKTLTIDGAYEYYLQRPRIVMTASTFERIFGASPVMTSFFVIRGDRTPSELNAALKNVDGFESLVDDYIFNKFGLDAMTPICLGLVVLYFILSALLAFFVLLDLFTMFVLEKKRELITLMINGFTKREAKRYITADTALLTVLGVLLGVAFGILLGLWNIGAMTSDASYFPHEINFLSCLIGASVCILLTALMLHTALRKMKKFGLADLAA